MPNKDTSKPALSELTIAQIRSVQKDRGGSVLAVGKYQAIPNTLKAWIESTGINTNTIFDINAQELLGNWLVAGKRPKIQQYINGSSDVSLDEAQLELAKEFASVPVPYQITRPAGAGGSNDPGRVVEAGQSYYYGVGGNTASASSTRYREALVKSRNTKNPAFLKEVIARGEGNIDSINRGIAGDTVTYSSEYYSALSGAGDANTTGIRAASIPTTTTNNLIDAYIKNVYSNPLRPTYGLYADYIDGLKEGGKEKYNLKIRISNRFRLSADQTSETAEIGIYDRSQIQGEFELFGAIEEAQVTAAAAQSSVIQKVSNLTASEQYFILTNNIIELYPDKMREDMAVNASTNTGENQNYAHAWRSPGKLAITADIRIPGAAGFRIGQIFWIGRTYESYKKFGAFQLFGLTENIDINRGWTTELHARFNAIPQSKLQGLRSE